MMISLYILGLITLFLFSLYRLYFLILFAFDQTESKKTPAGVEDWPSVTIQIPVYNERFVVERVLNAVSAFEYPKEALDIQILDDSTDETSQLIEQECRKISAQGIRCSHIRRSHRKGYKAGALAEGTLRARGEFIAVFDADFVPFKNFLKDTIPYFSDAQAAVVQAKWTYLNADESLLARTQEMTLGAHFDMEQRLRASYHFPLHFNGTAGVWRKCAILDSGGWRGDTLTEDLDLSFRAQLNGWKIIYLPHVCVPCELPTDLSTLRSQQYRWAKGSAQVFRKLWRGLLASNHPIGFKIESLMHLTSHSVYLAIAAMLISMPWIAHEFKDHPLWKWTNVGLFSFATVVMALFFMAPRFKNPRKIRTDLAPLLTALLSGPAFAFGTTVATVDGLFRRSGVFVRTPKKGDAGETSILYALPATRLAWLETLFCAYLWFSFLKSPIPYYVGFLVSATFPVLSNFHGWLRKPRTNGSNQLESKNAVQRQVG
jgi:cellulose synthase/poly-beta-1,6-N-acetylglucosamine synthase-like glycosyltransferase